MACKYLQWANVRRRANICCGQISDVQRSVGHYQQTCKDLLANIRRLAKIFWQISADVQRSFGKYQQTCKDLLRANISRQARSFVKYQKTCVDLWEKISGYAKIFWQISADVGRSIVGKYQNTCKDLWENISTRAKI